MAEIWGAVAAAGVGAAATMGSSAMSGGGGKGGGGGGGGQAAAPNPLNMLLMQQMGAYKPIQDEVYKQILEVLQTGGSSGLIPFTNSAMEASQHATSNTLRSMEERFAAAGLGGSNAAIRALTEAEMQGNQATGAIPSNTAMMFLQQALSGATNPLSTVTGGLAQLGKNQTGLQLGQMELDAKANAGMMELFGSGAGAIGQYAGAGGFKGMGKGGTTTTPGINSGLPYLPTGYAAP